MTLERTRYNSQKKTYVLSATKNKKVKNYFRWVLATTASLPQYGRFRFCVFSDIIFFFR